MSKIEFILDGRTIAAEPGQSIAEAAAAHGITIPTLCREQRISKSTSCFVCVVKDKKSGRFLPSCASLPAPGQEVESDSPAVREMRKTALDLLLSEHAGDCEAPCTIACPAHAQVEEYVRAGKEGNFLESLRIIKERIPLPMSIGRVCPRFCEKDCRRNVYGKPVAINDFKRLAADLHYDEYLEECLPETGKRVAIVGGGPAGLSVAYFLRRNGIGAKIFEAMPAAGGMLRYGIPEYRLPKATLAKELAHFEKLGVEFEFNRKLGENLSLAELNKEFDAVAFTIGCWNAYGMRCEGEDCARQGIDFLREVALNGNRGENPGRTIVIGGGNTAMDCIRTAVRLGSADVNCFYRRTEAEMPAEKIEIEEAKEEGVHFHFLTAPVSLRPENGRLVLTCRRMALGEPDASGRRKPVEVPGSDYEEVADTVIAAIGQGTILPAGVQGDRFGNIAVTPGSAKIGDRLYAAGDCVSGAATVVEAVGAAYKLVQELLADFAGEKYTPSRTINVSRGHWQSLQKDDLVFLRTDVSESDREVLKYLEPAVRVKSFAEVCETMTPDQIKREGTRCIECSCTAKSDCKLKQFSEEYSARPDAIPGAKLPVVYDNRHPVIIQDRGKCIKCGICVKICSEVVNYSLLSAKSRGFSTYVGTPFDQGFPQSCIACGECIRACPTGALDWRLKK